MVKVCDEFDIVFNIVVFVYSEVFILWLFRLWSEVLEGLLCCFFGGELGLFIYVW